MNQLDAVLRRVLFWTAMLTGVVLVGLQFGCERPQAIFSTAGFPHAGRWPVQRAALSAGVAVPKPVPASYIAAAQ